MAVNKFKTCLPDKEFGQLSKIAAKYYGGNRAGAVADAVRLLVKNKKRKEAKHGS